MLLHGKKINGTLDTLIMMRDNEDNPERKAEYQFCIRVFLANRTLIDDLETISESNKNNRTFFGKLKSFFCAKF